MRARFAGAVALLFLAGCGAARPDLVETRRQVTAYVESGRYEADITQVADEAKAWIGQRAGAGGKLAMVVDIDETALSNFKGLRANGYYLRAYYQSWVAADDAEKAQAEPIKPVVELVRAARERGVAVFFITGRTENYRGPTERNLRTAGYDWTAVILRPESFNTKSAVDFKAPERKKIVDQGYTIIVNIGDQMSDLDGGYSERTFKLPNPFYFIP